MYETASDMQTKSKKPEYDENDNNSPKHSIFC